MARVIAMSRSIAGDAPPARAFSRLLGQRGGDAQAQLPRVGRLQDEADGHAQAPRARRVVPGPVVRGPRQTHHRYAEPLGGLRSRRDGAASGSPEESFNPVGRLAVIESRDEANLKVGYLPSGPAAGASRGGSLRAPGGRRAAPSRRGGGGERQLLARRLAAADRWPGAAAVGVLRRRRSGPPGTAARGQNRAGGGTPAAGVAGRCGATAKKRDHPKARAVTGGYRSRLLAIWSSRPFRRPNRWRGAVRPVLRPQVRILWA